MARPIHHNESIPSHELQSRRAEAHKLMHTKHAPFIHHPDMPGLIKSKADTDRSTTKDTKHGS